MKRSMAGEIAAAGEYGALGRPKSLCGGGAVELAHLAVTRVMADEGRR